MSAFGGKADIPLAHAFLRLRGGASENSQPRIFLMEAECYDARLFQWERNEGSYVGPLAGDSATREEVRP